MDNRETIYADRRLSQCSPVLRRAKELCGKMIFQIPLAITVGTARTLIRVNSMMLFVYSLWRRRFGPYTLGIPGLVIAVVLWSAGYKLSLYHRHAAPPTVPIAKMWMESRNTFIAASFSPRAKPHIGPASQAFPSPIQRLLLLSCGIICTLSACTRYFANCDFLIPSRSPPTSFFLD